MSLETIEWASGLRFPQGPVWMPDGSVLVVETARGTLSRISGEGDVDVVADLGGGPSGAAVGPDGRIYVCNNGGSTWSEVNGMMVPGDQPDYYLGGCVQRIDPVSGEIDILYDSCNGHRLKSPSDLVFDGTGSFWFTDRGKTRPRDRDRGGLYYAASDGSSITEVVYPLDAPAGVGISPDGDTLYVAESLQGRLLQWPLSGPGEIAGYFGPQHRGTVLADPEGGPLFDALAVDAFGNICVATIGNGGVTTVTPDGVHFHQAFPDPLTTNLCFGGAERNLAFVTLSGTGRLVCRPWTSRGLPPAF